MTHSEASVRAAGVIFDSPHDLEREMAGERADVVAILAAIIYAGRTGESAQEPKEKEFGLIAKAAWDLHKAVVGSDEVHIGRAGFQQP